MRAAQSRLGTSGGMGAALLKTPEILCSILEALVAHIVAGVWHWDQRQDTAAGHGGGDGEPGEKAVCDGHHRADRALPHDAHEAQGTGASGWETGGCEAGVPRSGGWHA